MKIHIPNSAFLGNLHHFLRGYDPSDPIRLHISAHEKWIAVHPVALAMIAALAARVEFGSITCQKFTTKARNYVIRMGLLGFCGLDPGEHKVTEHEPAGRFIPLTQVRTSDEAGIFLKDMIPLLHLQEMPDQAFTLSYIVSELIRNVIEHSRSEHGAFVCAQYYKKSNSIKIGIADNGVGIKKSINQSHPAVTDMEAIRLALRPGVTGTTSREGGTSENAGAGLFFIKSIASLNRNFFVIYSGNAFYKLLRKKVAGRLDADPFDDKHSKGDTYPYWQGTVVGVDIDLGRTKEFSKLLDYLKDTYSKAIRERRESRHKLPRFT